MEFPIGKHVIVRTYSAGVFAGTLDAVEDNVVRLKDVRRLWYWDGASSLSELAGKGTSRPVKCKFAAAVEEITAREWIEIIPTTEAARKSIEEVPAWTQH